LLAVTFSDAERGVVVTADLTVSREKLVEAARKAILETRSRGVPVSCFAERRLMRTARTMSSVLLNGWRKGDCGCLVGTLFPDIEERLDSSRYDSYYRVGVVFNGKLWAALGNPQGAYAGNDLVVVVD
jgi:hypothetical protein